MSYIIQRERSMSILLIYKALYNFDKCGIFAKKELNENFGLHSNDDIQESKRLFDIISLTE